MLEAVVVLEKLEVVDVSLVVTELELVVPDEVDTDVEEALEVVSVVVVVVVLDNVTIEDEVLDELSVEPVILEMLVEDEVPTTTIQTRRESTLPMAVFTSYQSCTKRCTY